jgi:uncharacterized protein (TIGR02453 family)
MRKVFISIDQLYSNPTAMTALSKNTLQYLSELMQNNNRDWFLDNKKRFDDARQEFESFIDALILEIAKFDPAIAHHRAKDCIFRIYRDVRFSKDKSPYKTHFGAHVTAAAKRSEIHSRAGYYIHIEPGVSMLAGGAYLPQGPWLKAIRQEIAFNGEEFRKVLNAKDFVKHFGQMEGEKLKKAPKEYDADHPEIELLKHKSFLASNKCPDGQVTSEDFLSYSTEVFRALFPFDQFLNRATD